MSQIAPEIWKRLESSRPIGENLTARVAVPQHTDRLLCAIDAAMQRHLLVPLRAGEQELRDTESRGLSVETKDLTVHGYDVSRYLDIKCEDATGHNTFDLIGTEIAGVLSRDPSSPADTVHRVLAKWRRFWGQLPRHILSREQQLGLFAELWFLTMWLVPKIGASEATRRWRGPFGARHDFEWPGRSIEVKATTSTRGPMHHVHGIDQLAQPDDGDLLFYSLQLREEAGATNTLPTLVALCRERIEKDADAIAKLEIALGQAGYSPAHENEYARLRVRIVEEGLYAVTDRFPRLTRSIFLGGIPAGIEKINYETNLSGFSDLCIARSPGDFSST